MSGAWEGWVWAGTCWAVGDFDRGAWGTGAGDPNISVRLGEHHQCPGPAILPRTFLHQWAGLAAGTPPGPQRPGSKGEHDSGPGDAQGLGIQWAEPPASGDLLALGLLGLLPGPGCARTRTPGWPPPPRPGWALSSAFQKEAGSLALGAQGASRRRKCSEQPHRESPSG